MMQRISRTDERVFLREPWKSYRYIYAEEGDKESHDRWFQRLLKGANPSLLARDDSFSSKRVSLLNIDVPSTVIVDCNTANGVEVIIQDITRCEWLPGHRVRVIAAFPLFARPPPANEREKHRRYVARPYLDIVGTSCRETSS